MNQVLAIILVASVMVGTAAVIAIYAVEPFTDFVLSVLPPLPNKAGG